MGAVSGGKGEGETGRAAERQRRIDDIVGGRSAVDGDGANLISVGVRDGLYQTRLTVDLCVDGELGGFDGRGVGLVCQRELHDGLVVGEQHAAAGRGVLGPNGRAVDARHLGDAR